MFILYLDDSGSAANAAEQHLVLGGFCVFERQVHWLGQKLDDVAQQLMPTNPGAVEFHASEMWSGRVAPWQGMQKAARGEAIKRVLQTLVSAHATTRAFACAVHKASFPGQDPMELAFEDLCRRFDIMLKRSYEAKDPQRGIIVLDESSHETRLQELAHGFRAIGTRWGVLRNLVDVPLFVDSKASRLIQLADHIAYAVFRRYEAGDSSYLDVFAHRFDATPNGVIHGLSHLQHAMPACMCIACVSRRSQPPPE